MKRIALAGLAFIVALTVAACGKLKRSDWAWIEDGITCTAPDTAYACVIGFWPPGQAPGPDNCAFAKPLWTCASARGSAMATMGKVVGVLQEMQPKLKTAGWTVRWNCNDTGKRTQAPGSAPNNADPGFEAQDDSPPDGFTTCEDSSELLTGDYGELVTTGPSDPCAQPQAERVLIRVAPSSGPTPRDANTCAACGDQKCATSVCLAETSCSCWVGCLDLGGNEASCSAQCGPKSPITTTLASCLASKCAAECLDSSCGGTCGEAGALCGAEGEPACCSGVCSLSVCE
jgi:hypothetical protein